LTVITQSGLNIGDEVDLDVPTAIYSFVLFFLPQDGYYQAKHVED
jgi:hypothetical protein